MNEGSTTPRVAAIVLNYNGRDLTLDAVRSLLSMDYDALEVLHVDNGSSDGSSEAVATAFPAVVTVRVEENRGVVPGINRGLETALERGCDYALVLNNDIEVDPGMVRELVRVAEREPRAGAIGPKIYYHAEPDHLWSAGGHLRFRESVTRERGMGELDRGQYDRDEEVDYVNGCAMLVPRRVLEEVGPWDPLFHLAADDADWCMRMKSRGYRAWYAHKAVLWHKVGFTVGGYQARRTFYNGRSTALFVRRYGNARRWLSFLSFTAAALPLAFLRELPKGNQGAVVAKLRGLVEGLRIPLPPPPSY